MAKIVILDGHSVNPGDITWKALEGLGELIIYDWTSREETVSHIGDAEIVLTNKTRITKEVLAACPGIRYIGVLATGYNAVDTEAAAARGIPVTNVPAYSTSTVAQFTFALILELCHHVGLHDASVKNGDWIRSRDFCYWLRPVIELEGMTLGIIGFGQIGRRVASIARGFGLRLLVFTPHPDPALEDDTLKFVSLDQLLAASDIVSMHCPLTDSTKHMMDREAFGKMKQGSMFINVSRGPLVVEQDLRKALESGHLLGAACDVISREPMQPDNPLLHAPGILLTPHMAWGSVAARNRLLETAAENIRCWMEGRPVHVVS
ncbi:MAG: D-2-hydroxyacid dehydrogenase [Eubacteriales bacterium]|nr:D-2-hydroxyacid dehydrogenase [Eubacteriales bacterium]